MKIVYALYYEHDEELMLGAEDENYGNHLYYPFHTLNKRLEELGHTVSVRKKTPLAEADIAVFLNADEKLTDLARSLPKTTKKILWAFESPIYNPYVFHPESMFDGPWDIIMTWNRAFKHRKIRHIELPVTGTQKSSWFPPDKDREHQRGVVVSSYKGDVRGNTFFRDRLFKELATAGEIDLYGLNWRESKNIYGAIQHKIATMSKYSYALVTENAIYPGYVTEKLGDAILAGLPSIYYGDYEFAEKRFPGTFVHLQELSACGFNQAKTELLENYDRLIEQVKSAQQNSSRWLDSFINTFIDSIKHIQE